MAIPIERCSRKLRNSVNKLSNKLELAKNFVEENEQEMNVHVMESAKTKIDELEKAMEKITREKEEYIDKLEEMDQLDESMEEIMRNEIDKWDKEECDIDKKCGLMIDKIRNLINKLKQQDEKKNYEQELERKKMEIDFEKSKSTERMSSTVKLSGFAPPKWDGSPRKFTYWKKVFMELMQEAGINRDMIQIHWIRNSIPEEWKRCISGCETTEDVWNKLKIALPKERIISDIELDFRKLKPIKVRDREEILNFVNGVEDYCQQISSVGCEERTQDLVFINDILRKLPTDFQNNIRTSLRITNESRKLNGFTQIEQNKDRIIAELRDFAATYSGMNSEKRQISRNCEKYPQKQHSKVNYVTNSSQKTNETKNCSRPECKTQHALSECIAFMNWTPKERFEYCKKNHFCFSCLDKSHKRNSSCPKCSTCKGNHSYLLCFNNTDREKESSEISNARNVSTIVMNTVSQNGKSTIRLPIILAKVRSNVRDNEWLTVRCLVDGGSDTSLIRKAFAQRLGIGGRNVDLVYEVVGGHRKQEKSKEMNIEIRDINLQTGGNITVFSMNKVCEDGQSIKPTFFKKYSHLEKLEKLVDTTGGPIDLLIGRDAQHFIKEIDFIDLPRHLKEICPHGPVGIRYPLGWSIVGISDETYSRQGEKKIHRISKVAINTEEQSELKDLEKIFTNDMVGVSSTRKCVCSDEEILESNFIKSAEANTKINEEGRVEVALPWRTGYPDCLPNNYNEAKKDLVRQKKELCRKNEFEIYANEMDKLIKSDFVESVQDNDSKSGYYIVHQHVIRPDSESTPVRIVWNSARRNNLGYCMNDTLHKGPNLLNHILHCLIGFREKPVAFLGDIRKMFNMVSIREEDRRFHRFLWWDESGNITSYQWKRLIFGDSSSPDLAINALRFLASRSGYDKTPGANFIRNNTYMDDISGSTYSVEECSEIINQINEILNKGKFEIKYWHFNEKELEKRVNNLSCESELTNDTNVLGHFWDKEKDKIGLKKKTHIIPSIITKRELLRFIASIWDPLGFLAPVTIGLRIHYQSLWSQNKDWDQPLDDESSSEWYDYINEILPYYSTKIDRSLTPKEKDSGTEIESLEIHAFSDGGSDGYGACVYFRWLLKNGSVDVRFVAAKSFVIPIKGSWTTPRTELVGALVMVRLVKSITKSISTKPNRIVYWVDSKIVLHWIREKSSDRTKVFVGTRISEIQETADVESFRYVPSGENIADLLTRVNTNLNMNAFYQGPSLLKEKTLPNFETPQVREEIALETNVKELRPKQKKKKRFRVTRKNGKFQRQMNSCRGKFREILEIDAESKIENKNVLQKIADEKSWIDAVKIISEEHNEKEDEAKIRIIRALQDNEKFASDPKYRKLCSIYDEEKQLARVGGRLDRIEEFDLNVIAPIIIPSTKFPKGNTVPSDKFKVLTLIAEHIHQQTAHSGSNRCKVMAEQNGLWICKATKLFQFVKGKCFECRKRNRPLLEQRMGQIPDFCFCIGDPVFKSTSVDFFGPFSTKVGRTIKKGYTAIFTCNTTRAIHLEFCFDNEGGEGLTTEKFLMSFRRFTSIRGVKVATLYSDKGTNFLGAEKILASERKIWNHEIIKSGFELENKKHDREFKWIWNTPTASHMNGRVESLIRSVRRALDVTVGYHDRILTSDEWSTVMYEITYLINSRPIWPNRGKDVYDIDGTISPNFLLHGQGSSIARTNSEDSNIILPKRVDAIERRIQTFWTLWRKNMPPSLLLRSKWFSKNRNWESGDLVIIAKSIHGIDQPRAIWEVAIVDKTLPSSDGLVRKVLIKTKKGLYERPISKLCLIATKQELEENSLRLISEQDKETIENLS